VGIPLPFLVMEDLSLWSFTILLFVFVSDGQFQSIANWEKTRLRVKSFFSQYCFLGSPVPFLPNEFGIGALLKVKLKIFPAHQCDQYSYAFSSANNFS